MSLPDATVNKNLEGRGVRASIQRFGSFLAGMIMPNIGAFIAWGFVAALFISTGWIPNENLVTLSDPMLNYLLPLLIGYTGGRTIHGTRGAVVGAIATMGVIVGAEIPMFLGAMVMGPLAAWLLKKIDGFLDTRVPSGFEMLVDNFSLGILGLVLAILGHQGIGPLVNLFMSWMATGVDFLISHHMLPFASILVEPAKVLFLNNAINHGILTPLGTEQVHSAGQSILFMVESNPGPGLGLLLAYWAFGAKHIRQSVPGAVIIHLFGGIHEIFFPYVLMKPKTILATIAGAMSGLAVGSLLGAGLSGPSSPGSIIAWFLMCPRSGYLPMIADFLVATVVSFLVAAVLIRPDKKKDEAAAAIEEGGAVAAEATAAESAAAVASGEFDAAALTRLVVACDAGMGSSVMVASTMKKKLAPYGVEVVHTPIDSIPSDATVVLTQEGLAERAHAKVPQAAIIPFKNYVGDPVFTEVEEKIRSAQEGAGSGAADTAPQVSGDGDAAVAVAAARAARRKKSLAPDILPAEAIRLGLSAVDKQDAVRQAGQVLVDVQAAGPEYIDGMIEREGQVSTYMGEGFSIPHGTNEARAHIKRAALGFLQFPDGVDWNGKTCYVAIPIASASDEHIGIMSALASVLADKNRAEQLRTATTVEQVQELLAPEED
ncbi:PTS mannitol transporter subunit IICBA [Propionibacterium australiense]|uniref:Mannitol-specific phosphotransferase enzyme IIA component n=1 Tax=Propionibacterium australiense TaxID=119981 RepID=A0A383S9X2_9ACTN|nr:PTS mannitol transporter subunit IICBA [Propionibacterium australiense]RLP07183.1 PTS mannitol transporter subunit IICBA [Propionibacterium australiense]RLP07529.1 PTS mannitol transporter subunit IICBA [Propionibacterium australiense]SYZ34159.1 protein-Npi-phosphohistidine-sugar phosphotransferase [Propionibacterium australiense]VEH92553.1 EIICBA-Mtl [Propionibacterium australiense]